MRRPRGMDNSVSQTCGDGATLGACPPKKILLLSRRSTDLTLDNLENGGLGLLHVVGVAADDNVVRAPTAAAAAATARPTAATRRHVDTHVVGFLDPLQAAAFAANDAAIVARIDPKRLHLDRTLHFHNFEHLFLGQRHLLRGASQRDLVRPVLSVERDAPPKESGNAGGGGAGGWSDRTRVRCDMSHGGRPCARATHGMSMLAPVSARMPLMVAPPVPMMVRWIDDGTSSTSVTVLPPRRGPSPADAYGPRSPPQAVRAS